MKLLLSFIHYPVSSGRYMTEAFKRLGHDVKTCGWSTGNKIWGMQVADRYAHQPDGRIDQAFPDWTPDLVIHMDSAFAFHHPVYGDVPHVVYGVDNHVHDYRQDGIAHYFLAHKAVSVMDMNAEDVTWVPCGYDATVFYPVDAERYIDTALVGVPYSNRVQLIHAIEKADLYVLATLGELFDSYALMYHRSKISLNASAAHDLSQRIFETVACGCVVLTDALPDLAEIDYPKGAIVQYKDIDDAVKQAKAILKDWTQPDTSWLKEHTWDKRADVISAWYEANYQPKKKKVITNDQT